MKARKTKADRIREYLQKYPAADVAKVAEKFETAKPVVYKLRKELLDANVTTMEDAPFQIEMLDGPQDAGATWTATSNDAGDIVATLTERGNRYGKFSGHAQVTQEIKRVMSRHAAALNKTFTDSQWEALEMIAHKIGRIINGDPDYADSWVDIAGYAKLVADELEGVER
jgi:hypothetical protein